MVRFVRLSLHKVSVAVLAFLTLQVGQSRSQVDDDAFLASPQGKALVMITVRGQTGDGQVDSKQGTAFFISKTGFALTAAHLFFSNNDPLVKVDELFAPDGTQHIAGAIGSAGDSPKAFTLVELDEKRDIALIRLLGPVTNQQFLNICDSTPAGAALITVVGFPKADGPAFFRIKRTSNLVGKRLPFDETLEVGMGGAPILNEEGAVFAIAVPGLKGNFNDKNYGVPIRFLSEQATSGEATMDCSSNSATQLEPNKEDQAKLEELLREGEMSIGRDPATAKDKFEEAKVLDQSSWRANYNLARIAFDQGDYRTAQDLIGLAIKHHPTDITMYIGSALAKEGNKDFVGAEQDYQRIIESVPSDRFIAKNALFSLGQIRLRIAMQFPETKHADNYLDHSEEDFIKYLQTGTLPRYLAWYHLACIKAFRGDSAGAKTFISNAWQAVSSDHYQYRTDPSSYLTKLLDAELVKNEKPGDAVQCLKLKALAANKTIQTKP
ncbi:tetratricopeptide repeat-containing S1 family peptidase [Pararhizobium sp. PWRC1-1]|uniref:tetratricopeptide repeat-containing S1 family peptidase n=1 Tax=Pararhizobium sp. PWRC1-1 TaxID=2804566 RepID=UPI003CE9B90B